MIEKKVFFLSLGLELGLGPKVDMISTLHIHIGRQFIYKEKENKSDEIDGECVWRGKNECFVCLFIYNFESSEICEVNCVLLIVSWFGGFFFLLPFLKIPYIFKKELLYPIY